MTVSLTDVSVWMTRYVMSSYLALGICGNVINIYMFTRKSRLNNSCSLYLLVMSISHLLTATWGVIPALYTLDHVDPSTYSFIFCKLRLYSVHTIIMIGRTLLVVACIDRYALSSNSQVFRVLNNPKVAVRIIIGIVLAWPCINTYIPLITIYTGTSCFLRDSSTLIWAIYTVLVPGILVPVSVSTFGLLTIHNRHQLQRRVNGNRNNSNKRDSTLTIMLLGEVLVYVVSTILFPTTTLYKTVTNNYIKSNERQAIENFIFYLGGSFLIYLNPCATFYIFIIASRSYRKECKRVLVRLWVRLFAKNRVSAIPTGNTLANHLDTTLA